ncbi:MAG: Trk system potassium transporter TrkA [Clostridiales bacterium]|nr:Trk system potassium transporter TrkA [Clostridiales bacterium]
MLGFGSKTSGLKIIIVGAGKVGATLVQQLRKEGHDITIVDKSADKVNNLVDNFDIMGIVGNGASYTTQKEAGIDQADLIIAVTQSDELNLLCCTIAKQFSDCASIARVRTPDYSKEVGYLREKLGLARIINPELEAAKEMARILYLPTALEINSFAHGQAEMVKIKIPEGNMIVGKTIAYIGQNITNDILICAVEREGKVTIPSGGFELASGDIISFVSTRKAGAYFLSQIGFETKQVKNTMIIGGGRASYYLSDQLIKNGISVKIIEMSRARCDELNTLLPKAIIINGDGTNPDLLKEEGIADVDSFVPLTGIDEQNVMLTLHAKRLSKAKVITKINRTRFNEILYDLDLGSVVYPKFITSETIIAYVRALTATKDSDIETLYHMFDSRAEAIEFNVAEGSGVTGTPLKDLQLKKDLLIAFISHEGKIIIPTGNDVISEGDSIMVVSTSTGFKQISDILK